MQQVRITSTLMVILFVGYVAGRLHQPAGLPAAQLNDAVNLSAETKEAWTKSRRAISDAADALKPEGRYQAATEGINYFAVSVGGIDCIKDLDEGRGVDPETFGAIYAGRAIPEVTQHIDRDENGRLRYKGTVIRMYSEERLKQVLRQRDLLTAQSPGR